MSHWSYQQSVTFAQVFVETCKNQLKGKISSTEGLWLANKIQEDLDLPLKAFTTHQTLRSYMKPFSTSEIPFIVKGFVYEELVAKHSHVQRQFLWKTMSLSNKAPYQIAIQKINEDHNLHIHPDYQT